MFRCGRVTKGKLALDRLSPQGIQPKPANQTDLDINLYAGQIQEVTFPEYRPFCKKIDRYG